MTGLESRDVRVLDRCSLYDMGATAAVTCVARVGVREAGALSAEDARLRFSENCETSHIHNSVY